MANIFLAAGYLLAAIQSSAGAFAATMPAGHARCNNQSAPREIAPGTRPIQATVTIRLLTGGKSTSCEIRLSNDTQAVITVPRTPQQISWSSVDHPIGGGVMIYDINTILLFPGESFVKSIHLDKSVLPHGPYELRLEYCKKDQYVPQRLNRRVQMPASPQ